MLLAKVMLAIYIGLALLGIVMTIRALYRPLNATPEKLAAMKRILIMYSRLLFGALGIAVYALATKKYYLLPGSAIFACIVLPILVQYVRLKTALKTRVRA